MREVILQRLNQDIVGPYSEDETLFSRPSDVYLTGILWPQETPMGAEDDDRLGLSADGDDDQSGGADDEQVPMSDSSGHALRAFRSPWRERRLFRRLISLFASQPMSLFGWRLRKEAQRTRAKHGVAARSSMRFSEWRLRRRHAS